jgi:hypothetical protein
MTTQFVNDAKPRTPEYAGYFGYDKPSPYLFVHSRLLQGVISQAGTYLLTGKFHDKQCAIYKSEGGCRIEGVGDLVPHGRGCYFDYAVGREETRQEQLTKLAALITHLVLNWNPNDPHNSLVQEAAKFTGAPIMDLVTAVSKTSPNGNPFSGNALASFFDWNPFSKKPIDRDYLRFCLVTFHDWTQEQVDQKFADEDLGESLLDRINAKMKQLANERYFSPALCCSPRRTKDGLGFWVNTGRRTQVDGWHTQAELEDFINNATAIVDIAKY